MASRKYNFSHLSEQQLDQIAAKYPKAVETVTIRRPRYRILAMLAEAGAEMPDGVHLEAGAQEVAAQNAQAAASHIAATDGMPRPPRGLRG